MPPGTPQRNGVPNVVTVLTDLPLSFWGYALGTAAFTLNRAPSKYAEVMNCVKEICPRGNNKVVILSFLIHDKCLLFMLELY